VVWEECDSLAIDSQGRIWSLQYNIPALMDRGSSEVTNAGGAEGTDMAEGTSGRGGE